jgi:hypothetical protein
MSRVLWWKLPTFKVVTHDSSSARCTTNLLRYVRVPRVTWSSLQPVIAAICCHSQTVGLTDVHASSMQQRPKCHWRKPCVSLRNYKRQVFDITIIIRQYACSVTFTFVVQWACGLLSLPKQRNISYNKVDDRGSILGIFFATTSRLARQPTHPRIQRVPEDLPPGIKRPRFN